MLGGAGFAVERELPGADNAKPVLMKRCRVNKDDLKTMDLPEPVVKGLDKALFEEEKTWCWIALIEDSFVGRGEEG